MNEKSDMNEKSGSDNNTSNADGGSINWSSLGDNSSLNNPLIVPRVSVSPEALNYFSGAGSRYSGIFASAASISKAYRNALPAMDAIKESVSGISSVLKNLPDYTSMVQGMVPALSYLAEMAQEAVHGIDIKAISDAFRPIALKSKRVEILGRSNWPMYLIDDAEICSRLDMLPAGTSIRELRGLVSEIAFARLDTKWLKETRARWEGHDELTTGEKRVLESALDRHEKSDYEGCVALLVNLLEGLIERYCPPKLKKLEGDQAELFDLYAGKLGVNLSHNKKGKARELTNTKDKVLLLVLLSENGWYTFQHAADYIVSVILTNTMDADIAAHNPLRNKICHGAQTNFDTSEHSLKAILVTDIIIRFGAAVLAGQMEIDGDDDFKVSG